MMNLPPIEKLSEKMGNKYRLCVAISKRARQINAKNVELMINPEIKPISQAANEVIDGKVTVA